MSDDPSPPVALAFALSAAFGTNEGSPPVFSISAGVVADVTISFPGITLSVNDIEQSVTVVEIGPGDNGISLRGPSWQAPKLDLTGALSVDLPAVNGSGEVFSAADGSWEGGLQLALAAMSIDAFAIIGAKAPLSLAIVLSARFPLPGIQVGFGFAISGVGGVLAINRRSDRDALTAAILDGSIDGLLFARDPQADADRVVANLDKLFPVQPGQVVVGPMLEINWGAGLLTADLMLLVELPNPLQISLIGRVVVDLPFDEAGDDDIALIHLEARIAAIVTPGVPEVRVVASLTGSRILIFPITGDIFLLIRGGPEAAFVFSAGGFHPSFVPPPSVPPLKRIGLTMMVALTELRLSSYVAVTTSSVQAGAQIELNASVAGCGLHGSFGFDALIVWKPQFHFLVDVRIALAVQIFGETLCGVAFSGSLSGPGPWHLHGAGEVEVLWVTVKLPIDATFGSVPAVPPPPALDVFGLVQTELSKPASWTIRPPASVADGVTLTAAAHDDLAHSKVLHPGGGLHVAERLLPLGRQIDRFAGRTIAPQTFSIGNVTFGDQTGSQPVTPVCEEFADGSFTTLTDDQQLTTSGFTSEPAGVQISPTGLICSAVDSNPGRQWHDIVVNGDAAAGGNAIFSDLAALVPARGPAVASVIDGDPISPAPTAAATAGGADNPRWSR